MALAPKPVTLTQTNAQNYEGGFDPQPLIVVGSIPGAGITPQAAPTIDAAPADASAVASDLQDLVDALVLAGVLTDD